MIVSSSSTNIVSISWTSAFRRTPGGRTTRSLLVALLLTSLYTVYVSSGAQSPSTGNRPVGAVYTELCANCHGPSMAGGLAPSLLDDVWAHGGDDESLAKSIREGSPTAGMPSFKGPLSDREVRALVIYIREVRAKASTTAPGAPRKPSADEVFRSEKHAFRLETVVDNLDTPWSLEFLPDGVLLFTERNGQLRRVGGGKLDPIVIGGLPPIWTNPPAAGLMDVAAHPDYATNGWLYLSFSEPGGSAPGASSTRIIRARIRDHQLVDQETLFKAPPALYWEDNTHFGSRFLFDKNKYLYFSIGDRARMAVAQDLGSPYGKLHRIHDDGRVPSDNPFVAQAGAVKSVWSYGHRNQQGLAFHPATGDLWTSEHGPRGGDEVNLTMKGKNYGWPVITFGINEDGTPITDRTAADGMQQPAVQWTPAIAPSGIAFYTGERFPQWKHHLFVACLAGQQLRRLEVSGPKVTHQEVVFSGLGRVRDVTIGPDGYLYVATNAPGRILRLVPAS
jgi:glucose/arabinose dehydrogenase